MEHRGLEPLTPCLQSVGDVIAEPRLSAVLTRLGVLIGAVLRPRCCTSLLYIHLVCIAGAERNLFHYLAPLAGVWGLAPTLHNIIEPRGIVGSVATVSSRPHPHLISELPCLAARATSTAGGSGYVCDMSASAWSTSGCKVPGG